MGEGRLRVAIGIATAGRPTILGETLAVLRDQSRQPDRLIVSAPTREDSGEVAASNSGVEVLLGARGSSIQRNVILEAAGDCDIVLFLDDDFVAAADYIETLVDLHARHPDIVMFTGHVLKDGVTTGGIALADALAVLAEAPAVPPADPQDAYNGYGCNMSVRCDVALRHGVRFDERLPLYGWLEDVDFSRCVAQHGRIARSRALRGVHLGTKAGRQLGTRLGYSQIANPIYITRKGNLSVRRALIQIGRNVSANLLRVAKPEPHIDRRGRVRGNLIAFADLLRGKLAPDRILSL